VKVRWEESESFSFGLEFKPNSSSPIYVFNWTTWRWEQYLGASPVVVDASPSEWEDFWAGVLDVLIHDTRGTPKQFLPRGAIVPWRRTKPGFVQIGIIRTIQPVNVKAPDWYAKMPK